VRSAGEKIRLDHLNITFGINSKMVVAKLLKWALIEGVGSN
jgi:hypothetical protein